MSRPSVEVTGTLHEDGTLTLDAKPELPAGRVRVIVRPEESLVEHVLRSRKELEAAGSHFMNDEEVQAHLEWLREDDEELPRG